jgi:SAM-dependent methyltransferase
MYEMRFSQSLGYEFHDPDSGFILLPNNGDPRYWLRIEQLAREIHTLLDDMNPESEPTSQFVVVINHSTNEFSYKQAEGFLCRLRDKYSDTPITLIKIVKGSVSTKLVLEAPSAIYGRINEFIETETTWNQFGINVAALYPGSLHEIMQQVKERLIISGHTLNRFRADKIRDALKSLLESGKRVTLIMVNPKSKYAHAHAPYHELESEGPAEDQHKRAFDFLNKLFKSLNDESKVRFEVLLSHYMPRFRAIVVDDERAYLYLYMYGDDVNDYPDFVFEKSEQSSLTYEEAKNSVFTRVITSMDNLIKAPEIIPYIRYGRLYEYWEDSKLSQWDCWTREVRYRHRITHQYYVSHAEEFKEKFGAWLEPYVQEHLNELRGKTIVLGCGAGKEVQYLAEKCSELYGIDFSPEAIKLAQSEAPHLADRFIIADFYDLEHIVDGEFDSIAANAAFVHLFERNDMSEILQCIWRKLKPGGKCFIRNLYREKDKKPILPEYHRDKDRFNDQRWFVYYSRSNLAQLAADAGFFIDDDVTKTIARKCGFGKLKEVMEKGFPHFAYRDVYWPTILLVKPGSNERKVMRNVEKKRHNKRMHRSRRCESRMNCHPSTAAR